MERLLKFIKSYVTPHWRWYASGMIFLAITNIIMLEIPQIAKKIVNAINEESADLSDFQNLALLIIILGFLQILIRSLSRIMIFWPGRKLETNLKNDLFAKLLVLPRLFYDQQGFGDINSRLANDTGHIRVFFAFGVLQLFNMIFLSVFTVTKMISVHAWLTLSCILPLIILLFLTKLTMPLMHKYSKLVQESIGGLTNGITEAFVNIHTIHANVAYDSFQSRLSASNESVFQNNLRLTGIRIFLFPLIPSFSALSQVIILFYGGWLVMQKQVTVGDILAFSFYIGLLSFPLTAIGIIMAIYQRTRVALERIDVIKDSSIELGASEKVMEIEVSPTSDRKNQPLLTIKDLHFEYPEQKNTNFALDGINLQLDPGRKIGIFGAIGSGKTTLLNLICRIYDPPSGSIFLDQVDVVNLNPDHLRHVIAYVPQTVHLFSDTIYENIVFGLHPKPKLEQVKDAATKANILEDIEKFPDQWDTQIGEKGFKLSGGQKQRLALARAFVRQPDIMLLDDVLSAVDHKTEHKIIKAIYGAGCSLIITSHRPSVLAACERVIILESGKIAKSGTFQELQPLLTASESEVRTDSDHEGEENGSGGKEEGEREHE